MKISNFSGAVALGALLAGAGIAHPATAHDRDMSSEVRDLPVFSKIVVKGSADVNVVAGERQSVEVTTESDYLSRVETEVRGDTLYISQEGRNWRNVDVNLEVRVGNLNGVYVQGSGDFDIANLNSDAFEVIIQGSGDVVVSGKSKSFNLEIDGSGNVMLSGDCGSLDVEIDGSGDVDSRNLKCETVDVFIDGSGDVDVYASRSVVAEMEGSGDLKIYGDPDKIRPKIKGSGSFEVIDSK